MSISDEILGDHDGLGQIRHEIVLYYTYLAILSILFACVGGRLCDQSTLSNARYDQEIKPDVLLPYIPLW